MPPAGRTVWVTRAQPGAEATAARLAALGWTPLVAPLVETRPLPVAPPALDAVDALAFSSAAAVRAFADLTAQGRALPVYAVGTATARTAAEAGFARVRCADGALADLARLLTAELPPAARLLHPGALQPAGRLPNARALPVYETVAAPELPPSARDAVARGGPRAVLLHSPSAARAYAALSAQAPAAAPGTATAILALSAACAAPVAHLAARGLLQVAARPRDADLLALLQALD